MEKFGFVRWFGVNMLHSCFDTCYVTKSCVDWLTKTLAWGHGDHGSILGTSIYYILYL